MDFLLAGRGGEEKDWCCCFAVRFSGGGVGFVLQEYGNRFYGASERTTHSAKLQRMERAGCIVCSLTSSITRFVNLCSDDGALPAPVLLPSARRGGAEGKRTCSGRISVLFLQQGRSILFSREISNAGEGVVGVFHGRMAASPSTCIGDGFLRPTLDGFLQPPGLVANAEALACITVSSPFIAPSGFVPGDDEGDCAAASICGGRGADPDCISLFLLRVLCANFRDLVVISISSGFPFVSCNSTAEN